MKQSLISNEQGSLEYHASFSPGTEYSLIDRCIDWRHQEVTVYGKRHLQPRLTAWYGDSDIGYSYSGLKLEPQEWPQGLLHLKKKVEQLTGASFNGVLANKYRHGKDYMSWHRDDEKQLQRHGCIATVSLGSSRRFLIKDREGKKQEIMLIHGSLLLMAGAFQENFTHSVPKMLRVLDPRISLTFRKLHNNPI